jgi:hypothetical protein
MKIIYTKKIIRPTGAGNDWGLVINTIEPRKKTFTYNGFESEQEVLDSIKHKLDDIKAEFEGPELPPDYWNILRKAANGELPKDFNFKNYFNSTPKP